MKKLLMFILTLCALSTSAQQILMIGSDSRDLNKGNADLIIIITVHGKDVKMTSIMRDTYVKVKGYGYQKLNSAYRLGGGSLLMNTINSNFGTKLTASMAVDFSTAAKVIDCLDGVVMSVDPSLILYMNNYIQEQAGLKNIAPVFPSGRADSLVLTGDQAVAYGRVRVSDKKDPNYKKFNDFNRVERQHEIVMALFKKASSNKFQTVTQCAIRMFQFVDTDMTSKQYGNLLAALGSKPKWPEKNPSFPEINKDATYLNIPAIGSVLKIKDMKKASAKLRELIK